MTALSNKSEAFVNQYFATKQDVACLQQNNLCAKFLNQFANCPITINQTLQYVSQDGTYNCNDMYPFHQSICQQTLEFANTQQCPDLSIIQQYFYTIVITCTAGPITICFCFLLYRRLYRAEHISDEEVIKQALVLPNDLGMTGQSQLESRLSRIALHPEMDYILKKSKYRGVSFNTSTGTWEVEGTKRMYTTEQEAAKAAYLNTESVRRQERNEEKKRKQKEKEQKNLATLGDLEEGMNNINNDDASMIYSNPPAEEEVYLIETPEERLNRRKMQLIAFYKYWDSEKEDIPGHVDNLFKRHDFIHVARAVRAKYGLVPPGWDEEIALEETGV